MVESVTQYQARINEIKNELPKFLQSVLLKERDVIIKLLQDQQLSKGLDQDGNVVGVYSPATDSIASSLISIATGNTPRKDKIAGKPYNFEWSGGIFDGMDIMFEDDQTFTIYTKDAKAKLFKDKFGDIITLSDELNQYVNKEILEPAMYEYIIKRMPT